MKLTKIAQGIVGLLMIISFAILMIDAYHGRSQDMIMTGVFLFLFAWFIIYGFLIDT